MFATPALELTRTREPYQVSGSFALAFSAAMK